MLPPASEVRRPSAGNNGCVLGRLFYVVFASMGILSLPSLSRADTAQIGETGTAARAVNNLQKPVIVAPLTLNSSTGQLPVIRLSINGSKPLYFLFDTGSPEELHLASWAVRELGLKSVPEKDRTTGNTGNTLDPVRIEIVGKKQERYKLPSARPSTLPDSLVEAFRGIKLAGIIGLDLAVRHTICLDPAAQTMTLYSPSAQPVHVAGAAVVPLLPSTVVQGGAFRDVSVTFPGDNPAKPHRMLLDTGSSNVVLPLRDVTAIEDLRVSRQTVPSTTMYGTRVGFAALLPRMTVGDRKEANVPVVVVRGDSVRPVLGMGFLSRFKTTLDLAHNQMLLQPTPDYQKRVRIPGDVGFQIAREDGVLSVSFVDMQGAAYKAGLRPHDTIEAIDGIEATRMDPAAAEQLLPQRLGTSARVRARHKGGKDEKPFEVTLTAEDPYLPVWKKLVFGFNLGGGVLIDSGKPDILVTGVAPGSSAAEAGLRVGDRLLSIRNKPTAGMDMEEQVAYFRDPTSSDPFPITVQRPGEKEPVRMMIAPKMQSLLDTLPWPEEQAAAQPVVKPVTIPFGYDPPRSRLLTIRARVNGSPPLLFVVNTNLRSSFVLFSWALESTGLKLLPDKDQPAGTGSGSSLPKITEPCVLRPELAAGSVDASAPLPYAIVTDEHAAVRNYPEGRVAGAVGSNFLTSINSVLDFDSKTLRWYSVLPPSSAGASSVVLPLKKVSGNPTGLYIEAVVASDKDTTGSPMTFLLDTGSTNSFLPQSVAGSTSDVANGIVMRRLKFGDIGIDGVSMYVRPGTSEPTLGLDVLSRFQITVDKAKGVVLLVPRR